MKWVKSLFGTKPPAETLPKIAPKPGDDKRSKDWPKVRAAHLLVEKVCRACGEADPKKLNVHHILPFHGYPSRELDPLNLITLCEGDGCNCHFTFGHLLDWKSWNPMVRRDADDFYVKVRRRPRG